MTAELELVAPGHCFCEIPEKELRHWVVKRYVEHHTTIELLNSTDDPREREIICIVGLIDVEEKLLLQIMSHVGKSKQHIIECREAAKRLLRVTNAHAGGSVSSSS